MAIDTRTKRLGMLNFETGNTWHSLHDVDGSVDLDDRAYLLDLYGGIALGAATPLTAEAGAVVVIPGGDVVTFEGGDSVVIPGGDLVALAE